MYLCFGLLVQDSNSLLDGCIVVDDSSDSFTDASNILMTNDVTAHDDALSACIQRSTDVSEDVLDLLSLAAAQNQDGSVAVVDNGLELSTADELGLDDISTQVCGLTASKAHQVDSTGVDAFGTLEAVGQSLGADGQAVLLAVSSQLSQVLQGVLVLLGAGQAHAQHGVSANADCVLCGVQQIQGIHGLTDHGSTAVSTHHDTSIAEVIIAKNRHGSTGTVNMGWNGQFTKFVTIADERDVGV